MRELTLPSGGRIDAIIHFSDVHIKIGDLEKSRYDDYLSAFINFEQMIMKIPQVRKGTAVTIFCGDFFHHKNKLDSLSVMLFNLLIEKITKHTPLYIIQGNHDYLQADVNIPDVISSLLYNNQNKMVNYIDQTGHYLAGNVGIGFVCIKDVLQGGNGCGYVEKLPPFPDIKAFPPTVTTKVALFHGSFNKANFYNGMCASDGLPIDWIKSSGYQLGLFGDIHKTQVHPNGSNKWDSEFTWGYSGSLLQLDFGEDPRDHGFLLWDLVQCTVVHYDVPTRTRFLNVIHEDNQLYVYVDRKQKLPIEQVNVEGIAHLNVKFKGDVPVSVTETLQESLKTKNITSNVTKGFLAFKFNGSDSVLKQRGTQVDITQYNSPHKWIEYIQQSDTDNVLGNHPWKEWITRPETLLLSGLQINNHELSKTVHKRDTEIRDVIGRLENNLNQIKMTSKQPFSVHYMKWQWILCYGHGNHYNFDNNKSKICVVNGVNSSGKTSFLETLAYGLYGEEFPSRKDCSNTSAIICRKKPEGQTAQIDVVFSVGNDYHRVSRTLVPQSSNDRTVKCKKISLEMIDIRDGSPLSCISTSATEIKKWFVDKVGTFDSFMMSCLITQNSDCDFYSYKDAEQIKMLDETLHLDCIDDMSLVINKVQLGLDDLRDRCISMKSYLDNESKTNPCDVGMINKIQSEIGEKNKLLDAMRKECEGINETWHDLSPDDLCQNEQTIKQNIEECEKSLSGYTVGEEDMNLLLQEKAVLTEKTKLYGNHSVSVMYNEGIHKVLRDLESTTVIKPPCERAFYQREIELMRKWRDQHQQVLKKTVNGVVKEIEKMDSEYQTASESLELLSRKRPNRPDITIEEYREFARKLAQIKESIGGLEQQYNTPEKLLVYCQEHPLPKIDNNDSLEGLRTKLVALTRQFKDDKWCRLTVSQLTKMVEEKEKLMKYKETQIVRSSGDHETTIKKISQLSEEIVECERIIDTIGHLSKPSIPYGSVKQWLERYNGMVGELENKTNLLSSQEKIMMEYSTKQKIYEDSRDQIGRLSKEMDGILTQKIPFNPHCDACRQQPWKIRQERIADEIKKHEETMVSIGDLSMKIKQLEIQINQTRKWMEEIRICKMSLSDYQKWNLEWDYYQTNVGNYELNHETRVSKQKELVLLRQSEQQIARDVRVMENEKRELQKIVDGLHNAINNKPNLENLQRQMDERVAWDAESRLHKINEQYNNLDGVYYADQMRLIDETERWTREYDENTQKNRRLGEKLVVLRDNLSILRENERYKLKEIDYLENIKMWDLYDEHRLRLSEIRQCVHSHQLRTIDAKMEAIRERRKSVQKLKYWTSVRDNKLSYNNKKRLNASIVQLTSDIQRLNVTYGHQKNIQDTYIKNMSQIVVYDSLINKLTENMNAVRVIGKSLSGYRIWLYENIVVPETVKMVNSIMVNVTQKDDYRLGGSITVKNGKININWSVDGPTGKSTIEKVGGFRKHLIGLIMRISLSKQGCTNINNTQIFLDESFVSCDVANLDKMPQFLTNLLDIFTGGIILVSHLPTIRDCGHHYVSIERNIDQTSLIHFGETNIIPRQKVTLVPQSGVEVKRKIQIKLKPSDDHK